MSRLNEADIWAELKVYHLYEALARLECDPFDYRTYICCLFLFATETVMHNVY